MAILPPTLKSIEEDAFRGTGSCDFYMFDGNAVPSVHNKGVNVASHWYVSKPQNYVQKSYCNGLLPISAMAPQDEFVADNLTFRIVQEAQYPGVFTASAYKKSDKKPWTSEFKDLKAAVHNPTFAGKWNPEYRINGIDANFFTGNDIVKLHHIALPASIEPAQSKKAFAQCKALVSLDLSAMSPLSKAESDALLSGLPEFTIVYAPKTQAQEHRAANTVLTSKDGKRHTSLYKMQLDDNFDALTLQGNLAYRLPYSFEAKRATFFRSSFKHKKKETLVLPFAAKPRGKAFAFDGMDKQSGTNTTLKFAKKDELQANTPYIYASDGTEIWAENVVVNPQNSTNTPTKDGLFGVYKADFVKALAAAQQLNGAAYTLNAEGNKGNATFVQATDDAKLTPFHAFLHLADMLVGANLKLVFEGEETTGIEKVANDVDNENNTWYNLQGIKYNSKPQKGIYIRNGKKVVVQ
jgi:putative surface antigen bspA